jgi:branched-chain amino acid aminotransferase
MYGADAAFFCGTAAEVIGLESLDNQTFAKAWNDSVSKKIQVIYKDLVISF